MRPARRSEQGVTLVELLISVVILSLITGALSAAFVTALNSARPTEQRVRESDDAQLIAAYLVRDAQSAGGSNPTLGGRDTSQGVSAPATATDCATPAGSLVVRFEWRDFLPNVAAPQDRVANYFFDDTTNQLIRKSCVDGAQESILTLGRNVASVAPPRCVTAHVESDCSPTPSLPDVVKLTVTATKDPTNPSPYTYTLVASTRPEGQSGPTLLTSTLVPLIALGTNCTDGLTGNQSDGGSSVNVYGGAEINGGCPAVNFSGAIDFNATGGISVLAPSTCDGTTLPCGVSTQPMGDPFTALAPPAADCVNGTHAGPGGTTYSPGVYQSAVTVTDATFLPGTYVFCNGLTTNGTVTANGVLFYFAGGALSVLGGHFSATAPTTGPYGSGAGGADIVVWQTLVDTAHTPGGVSVCCADDVHANFGGTIYASHSFVSLHNGNIAAKSIVARGAAWTGGGTGGTTIGTPPAVPLTLDTTSLRAWTVNRPYPSATLAASGGTGGYAWSATGMPPGLSLDPATGTITGTPTVANTYNVKATVTDSIGERVTKIFSLRVNAVPSVNGPASLPNFTVNRDYFDTAVTATAGTTPYAWSAVGLPPGIAIAPTTGVVAGTPRVTGTFTATVKVTDAAGATATRAYTITINSTPTITGPATLPSWTAGQAYPAQTITHANGTAPLTWTASGLPNGLSINAVSGVISGTPSVAGTFAATVTVTDAAGATGAIAYSIVINPAPGIATGSLPNGEQGRPYNFTVSPTAGGTRPFRWTATNLPAGLSIGLRTGTISGTPTVSGTFNNVAVTIRDRTGASATKTYTLAIAAPVSISGPATLGDWTVGGTYRGTQVTATDGVAPYVWSAAGLPPGLAINAATGVISGIPNTTGSYGVAVTVLDALGGTSQQLYPMTINVMPSIATVKLPVGEQTVPYSTTVVAAGGTPNGAGQYTWAASGLPTGLSVDAATGRISGTPTQSGTFDITLTATDSTGASASRIFLAVDFTQTPSISDPPTLPDGTRGVPYPATTITTTGGTPPLTWSATGLPAGLTIDASTGTISGTPSLSGVFAVTVRVTDTFSLGTSADYSLTISAAPTITTGSLPSSTVNTAYPVITLSAGGGTAPRTWSAAGLPPGLSLASASGVLSGTPTAPGSFTPTITVTDSLGANDTQTFPVTINDVPSITTAALPDAVQNVDYSELLDGAGGTLPYTWSATGLPSNLTMTTDGLISGRAGVTGSFTVNITLTDASGATAGATLTLAVNPQIVIAPASGALASGTIATPYAPTTITATGGVGTYTWSAGGLPSGMSIDPVTGVISGTPTVAVDTTVTVTVVDGAAPTQSASCTYTLTISP